MPLQKLQNVSVEIQYYYLNPLVQDLEHNESETTSE